MNVFYLSRVQNKRRGTACWQAVWTGCLRFVYGIPWPWRWTSLVFLHVSGSARTILWAGFSHRLGTRHVMDELVANISECSHKSCLDVEHDSLDLGVLMRERGCFR